MALSLYGGGANGYRSYPARQTRSLYNDFGRWQGKEPEVYRDGGDYLSGQTFPFTTIRVLGVVLVVFAVVIFILGITALALNVTGDDANYNLMVFGAVSMSITTILTASSGVIGFLHSEYRENLEAYRNSFMVLCVVTSLFCLSMMVTESMMQYAVYGQFYGVLEGAASTNSAIWITLIILTSVICILAAIGSFITCCLPGLCTPIVDNDAYVYTYDRLMPEIGQSPLFGPPRRTYVEEAPRKYELTPRRYSRAAPPRYTREEYPSYATGPRRGRYY